MTRHSISTASRLIILTLLAAATLLGGCTHNNGNIGPWFGTWKLTAVEADGEAEAAYQGDMFWMFQASVICMREVLPHHDYQSHWGSWRQTSATEMEVTYGYSDERYPQGSKYYTPPEITRLPNGQATLRIVHLTDRRAVLQYTTPTGEVMTYRLAKWE